ncbi:hypothetical protein CVT26_008146, partial [Gymnopilus dilepis]
PERKERKKDSFHTWQAEIEKGREAYPRRIWYAPCLVGPSQHSAEQQTHRALSLFLFFSLSSPTEGPAMQSRRGTGLTPLAIITPHPPLPRRRSSLLSLNSAASPHTPRSCPSPSLPVLYPANRNSTDSWNSSNADELEFEWKQDQVLLLSRTLDALPAHLLTPFNGPVPPSNLLDKIARGVAHAKGPLDWPHSIRATRVKLLELARSRAKEDAAPARRRHVIQEEVEVVDSENYAYFQDGEEKPIVSASSVGPRRPPYRQSSMDFIKPSPAELKDNANIARLSSRLQRSDRIFPNPSYHPYSRIPRSSQAAHSSDDSSDGPAMNLMNPSTPSSSTLNSFSSLSSAPRLQRSVSTMSSGTLFSSNSSSSDGMLVDPRVQRIRRSESFSSSTPPAPPPKDVLPPPPPPPQRAGYKRAPSYGKLALEAREEAKAADRVHERKLSGSYPSSDEEEKARSRRAKKIKTKTAVGVPAAVAMGSPVSSPPASSVPSSPAARLGTDTVPSSPVVSKAPVPPAKDKLLMSPKIKAKSGVEVKSSPKPLKSSKASSNSHKTEASKTGKASDKATAKDKDAHASVVRPRPAPMNLQRNPSMFGAELPHLRNSNSNANANAMSVDSPVHCQAPTTTFIPSLAPSHAHVHAHSPTKSRLPTPRVPALSPSLALAPALDLPTSPPPPLSPAPTLLSSPSSPCPSSPSTQRVRTLRRVRRLGGGGPARRISFGSLVAPGEEADAEGEGEGGMSMVGVSSSPRCLGSAFQLL